MADETLQTIVSFNGNSIRLTVKQWMHIVENHNYMAGNMDKVLETLADPAELIEGKSGEVLALREYPQTNITRKTAVVVYREQPDGFVITAFFTSRPDKIRRKEQRNG